MTTHDSKTVLITGATNGIGRAAAQSLADDGWRVLIAARDPQRTQDTIADIQRQTGSDQVSGIPLELTSLASVREAAAQALNDAPRLDVLINNAGLNLSQRSVTPDGFETMMQVNHFGHFLLTSLLLPRLRQADDARVVNVTSIVHRRAGPMPFDDLNLEKRWGQFWPYAVSKQANILFMHELHRRYHDDNGCGAGGISTYAVHPGGVRTNFGQDGMMTGPLSWFLKVVRPLMLSPERGAAPLVELAQDPEAESGGYYTRHQKRDPAPDARDPEAAARLWEVSNELTGAAWPTP